MAMFSTFIAWQLIQRGWPYWVAFFVTVALSFAVGVLIERIILRPLENAPVLTIVVVFIGLLAIFNSLAGWIFDHTIKAFPSPFPKESVAGHASTSRPHQLGMIVRDAGACCWRCSPSSASPRSGLAMRAAAQNPDSARLVGIRVSLDAGAGLGPGGGHRRGGRHDGGAGRLPRPQHDGRHPALRLCRRAAGRHRQPAAARWSAASSSACWRTCSAPTSSAPN